MVKKSSLAASLTVASMMLLGAGAAQATTLTFDTNADCSTSEVSIASPGPIFGPCGLGGSPNGTSALVQLGDGVSYWVAVFTSVVSNVSIDLGDFNQDADRLFLWAWDENNNDLLPNAEVDIAANFTGMVTLSLALSGIKSIVFGVYGSGVYADNLTFTPAPRVPLPAALPLLLTGLGGLGFVGWRRKRSAASA